MKQLTRFLSLALLTCSLESHAAVPNLSDAERTSQAKLIVEGKVIATGQSEEAVLGRGEGYSNFIYNAYVKVDHVVKGDAQVGDVVEFNYWRVKNRPQGWAGHQGQNSAVVEGTKIRAYLENTSLGDWELVKPNGFDLVESCGH